MDYIGYGETELLHNQTLSLSPLVTPLKSGPFALSGDKLIGEQTTCCHSQWEV